MEKTPSQKSTNENGIKAAGVRKTSLMGGRKQNVLYSWIIIFDYFSFYLTATLFISISNFLTETDRCDHPLKAS